jgi:multicomponent Na+:H+ antiporter subunit A
MSLLWTLLVLVVALVAVAPMTRVLGRNTGWPLAALYVASWVAFLPAIREVLGGGETVWTVPWVPELGVDLAFRADGLGVVFGSIALLIGAVVLVYATRYLEPGRQLGFYLVMAVFTLSMMGLVLANDLIVLFISWELTSLASFLLIAQGGRYGELASMRTLLITFVGGLAMIPAVMLIIARTGTTSVTEALAHPVWGSDPAFTSLVAVLVAIAAMTKSAQFPFHLWLPDAMAASTPVSAYLHAAAVVKAGIFLLMRFSPAFHDTLVWNVLLLVVGLYTALLGGRVALQQTDLKKLMAYSTVSQLGLIVATIGIGTEYAITAAVLHTIAHALFKSGLFMMVGVVDHATHTRDLRRLPQLYRQMPWTFAVVVLGTASMAGVPPMLGFISKESMLAAMRQAPGDAWAGWAALIVMAAGAVLTFAYSVRIVFGGFVDGTDPRPVQGTTPGLFLPAALPIVVSVPLAFAVGVLDVPVGRAVAAALPHLEVETHLYLWHGFTVELLVTALVIAAGVAVILRRRQLQGLFEKTLLPIDGVEVIHRIHVGARALGVRVNRTVEADYATRHAAAIVTTFVAVIGAGLLAVLPDLPPVTPNLSQPIDVILLVLIAAAVVMVVAARSRLAATVSLSAVGILATVQIIALGAPDVGLTQLLVEALTIIVIMLVLQKLPLTFGSPTRFVRSPALLLSLAAGVVFGGATWMLTGRRERSPVAEWYLTEAPEEAGAYNIVNVILVEFRALDTLGELTVLGMAGVAIIAVLSTVRERYLEPERDADEPDPELRAPGSTAERAIHEAWPNLVPLQLVLRATGPLLLLISFVLFMRGHNAPGGGFIAALVASAAIGLIYLTTSRDRRIGPPRLPLYLIGGGVAFAILTGLVGLVAADSFLEPLYGYVFTTHVSTSMLFDVGVFAAVVGLLTVAFNLLGSAPRRRDSESTRLRVDESVEGALFGTHDPVQGDRPPRVGASTSHVVDGVPPRELGR